MTKRILFLIILSTSGCNLPNQSASVQRPVGNYSDADLAKQYDRVANSRSTPPVVIESFNNKALNSFQDGSFYSAAEIVFKLPTVLFANKSGDSIGATLIFDHLKCNYVAEKANSSETEKTDESSDFPVNLILNQCEDDSGRVTNETEVTSLSVALHVEDKEMPASECKAKAVIEIIKD